MSNTVCWGPGSNIVTAGRGCDSVDPIFNYVDTHKQEYISTANVLLTQVMHLTK